MDFSLIIDWLGREGGHIVAWWLLVTLAGAAVWPLLMRVAGGLPDRGYTLARAAGLMLTGFVFWFLGSLGLLHNTPGGMAFAWLVVIGASAAAYARPDARPAWRDWWRAHRALVIVTEIVFAALFVGWAAVRAHQPEMASTEKPMEVMFINAIRASESFPPRDAWLSGYAISYYYFGYVIVAMLADLSSVGSGIAFNLAIALIVALTGIGALGVVYNLVRAPLAWGRRAGTVPGSAAQGIAAGVLALLFVVFMGNLGTALVELPYRGYAPGLVNAAYFDFWDVPERNGTSTVDLGGGETVTRPADDDGDGIPNWEDDALPFDEWSFTWGLGWRYSRIVNDKDLAGRPLDIQPITEFPNFSFVLADIHPHVLALPFAMLAVGLALGLVLRGAETRPWEYVLYAIWAGGMIFVNSWDAVYLVLLVGAEALRRLLRNGGVLHNADLLLTLRFGALLGALTGTLYLPWLMSFTSQASGILPNLIYPTAWQQYILQFGVFAVILAVFLLVEMRRAGERFNWLIGLLAVKLAAVTAIAILLLLGWQAWERVDVFGSVFAGVNRATESFGGVLPDVLRRRLIALPSEVLLLAFLGLIMGRLFARPPRGTVAQADLDEREIDDQGVIRVRAINYSAATGFALLLAGAGVVLTLVPDVFYLRDNFTVRINTVFKLYYQGWIMFSLASAYAVWSVLAGERVPAARRESVGALGRPVFGVAVIALLTGGLLYPVFATQARALVDTGRLRLQERIDACEKGEAWAVAEDGDCPEQKSLTLDGAPTMVAADEYAAIQCLAALEISGDAVLVEAPGGAYEPHKSRFSALTGIPTLIGWQNHERQWRGPTYPQVTDWRIENGTRRDRASDVQELYTTIDWARAWAVIDRYGVDYIVVGNAERQMIMQMAGDDAGRLQEYQRGLDKFAQVLKPVCEVGGAAVYRVAPR